MQTTVRKALGLGLIVVVSALVVAPPAWSDDRKDDRREHRREHRRERWDERREHHREVERRREAERRHEAWRRAAEHREWERRRAFERHRAAAHWRFERDRGWRWEHRPGVWSPFFVWWAIDGRPLLRPYPAARIVRYPTGYYELVGDGITVPFYWVWRQTAVVAAPPPVPLPPAIPSGYELPPEGFYPPPPGFPAG
jgi:hypothetical protein